MRALLLALALTACGPAPKSTEDFVGRYVGMMTVLRQCADGHGSNAALPSWWTVTATAHGGLHMDTGHRVLSAKMTEDGAEPGVQPYDNGETVEGGLLWKDGASLQVRLTIKGNDCEGADVGVLGKAKES